MILKDLRLMNWWFWTDDFAAYVAGVDYTIYKPAGESDIKYYNKCIKI